MYELEFANKSLWSTEQAFSQDTQTNLKIENVNYTQLIYWREHCLECTPPDCYHSCQLYAPRIDKRCIRFKYGIYPNSAFKGLFDFGADIRFQPWAKLGNNLYRRSITPQAHRTLSQLDYISAKIVNIVFRFTNPLNPYNWLNITPYNPQRLIYKSFSFIRERCLKFFGRLGRMAKVNYFIMECFSNEKESFRIQLEYTDSVIRYRDYFVIKPGHNYYEIPFKAFNSPTNPPSGSMIVYPENNATIRLIFTWLDFVNKKTVTKEIESQATNPVPAEKIKCVAWDLDNTIWQGILIEDGKDRIKIRSEVVNTIHKLDERGIIQTIVSKNNYEDVWPILTENGLRDYFIYPAINWAPKSTNLKQIADKININIDTFALIDDSPFERAEVSTAFPEVRVYSEKEVISLLSYPELDVPITEASKARRLSYLSEMQRERVMQEFSGDYVAFLRHCRMEMRLFIPEHTDQIKRCHELIQRSNQLNLSSKRYSSSEFNNLLKTERILSVAIHFADRFGDYGIVAFASVDESRAIPQLMDFVISCRVAQKFVENTFFEWLGEREKGRGHTILEANLIKTKRNGPLARVFESLPFEIIDETEQIIKYHLLLNKLASKSDVIKVIVNI